MFERPEGRTIEIDGEAVTFIEVTDDSIAWKAIVAGQANEGAILGFTPKQRTVFQNGGRTWRAAAAAVVTTVGGFMKGRI